MDTCIFLLRWICVNSIYLWNAENIVSVINTIEYFKHVKHYQSPCFEPLNDKKNNNPTAYFVNTFNVSYRFTYALSYFFFVHFFFLIEFSNIVSTLVSITNKEHLHFNSRRAACSVNQIRQKKGVNICTYK